MAAFKEVRQYGPRPTGDRRGAWRASSPIKSDLRPLDTRYDNAWGALRDWLRAVASLPADEHPDAARADTLLEVLFPTGADFLKLAYAKQWAECDKRIKTVAERGLAAEIGELAGAVFWSEIQSVSESKLVSGRC